MGNEAGVATTGPSDTGWRKEMDDSNEEKKKSRETRAHIKCKSHKLETNTVSHRHLTW